ncbi:MAG: copper resistance protein NlpE N-terminal domain-containing protein, partial [Flavobacterium sp.]
SDSTSVVIDHHTSQLSLDYLGTYKGVVPCADCAGIETTLALVDETNYELKMLYLGKSKTPFEYKGTYAWKEDGSTIVLSNLDGGTNQYKVVENGLIQLDLQGNRITGELGRKYLLQKELQEISITDEELMNQINEHVKNATNGKQQKTNLSSPVLGTKWKLVELNGKPIAKKDANAKEHFLQLNKENRFAAYAGCNNMMGSYELKEDALRIKFSKVASTMMACDDMNTEQEFAKVLETVDNYSLADGKLSLNKARMAPLARFETMK